MIRARRLQLRQTAILVSATHAEPSNIHLAELLREAAMQAAAEERPICEVAVSTHPSLSLEDPGITTTVKLRLTPDADDDPIVKSR